MAPKKTHHPRKRFYRARAHSNPLSDSQFPVPISPARIDWSEHFPAFFKPPLDSLAEEANSVSTNSADRHVYGGQKGDAQHPLSEAEVDGQKGDSNADVQVGDGETRHFKDPPDVRKEAKADLAVLGDGGKANLNHTGIQQASSEPKVRFADIGCGFGGLLVKLSPMFPSTLMIGMELRDKVSEYVKERILSLRKESPGQYQNISIIRTNAMKYLQNYFQKGQLQKMFFLFPDPHFKERNHRRRVISVALLAEYAHVMAVGGILYTITDVQELGEWMKSCLDAHPLFEEVSTQEQELDPVVKLLKSATEEGQKVERNSGETFHSVYQRVSPPGDGA